MLERFRAFNRTHYCPEILFPGYSFEFVERARTLSTWLDLTNSKTVDKVRS